MRNYFENTSRIFNTNINITIRTYFYFSETTNTFQIKWDSRTAPDGLHTVSVLAMDDRDNSNAVSAPLVEFIVDNNAPSADSLTGLDWLLEHQWRNSDDHRQCHLWQHQKQLNRSQTSCTGWSQNPAWEGFNSWSA